MNIATAMERILARCPRRVTDTVDTVKRGDAQQELRGVVCTFTATRSVLDQAARLGANFVITHEPTYWNHPDYTDWVATDGVYLDKVAAIDANQQVVWRLHDQVHGEWPDVIEQGVLKALGWKAEKENHLVRVPPQRLADLIAHLKSRLGIAMVRFTGDPDMIVNVVALTPGSGGWMAQMKLVLNGDVDVLVTGESAECEACEYIRDAVAPRKPKAIIVLGHCPSEDAGVGAVAELVRAALPGVPVTHLAAGAPFKFA